MGSVSWSARDEELQVEWSGVSPSSIHLTGYLVEWVNVQQQDLKTNWQRVPHNVNTTTLTGTSFIFSKPLLAKKLAHMESVQISLHFNSLIVCGTAVG